MQPENYFKCPCRKCGGHIEFPGDGVGQVIACPHCGQNTELFFLAAEGETIPAVPREKQFRPILLISLVCAGLVAAAAIYFFYLKKEPTPTPEIKIVVASTNQPAAKRKVTKGVDWNGLKSGEVTIDKSGNSRLIYAVGTIRNGSDRQRFGVKVELELFDAQDEKAGTATDYVQFIDAHKEWKFRALVTDPKAVRAKISAVKEN